MCSIILLLLRLLLLLIVLVTTVMWPVTAVCKTVCIGRMLLLLMRIVVCMRCCVNCFCRYSVVLLLLLLRLLRLLLLNAVVHGGISLDINWVVRMLIEFTRLLATASLTLFFCHALPAASAGHARSCTCSSCNAALELRRIRSKHAHGITRIRQI